MKEIIDDFVVGNKHVSLTIDLQTFDATSLITSIPEANKISGDTTQVHKQVKITIENVCKSLKHDIVYRFDTTHKKMRLWGLDQGNEIFSWNRIRDDGENFSAWTNILFKY